MNWVSVQTICGFCASGCGMRIETRGGGIHKVSGDPRHPVSRGRLCINGAHARDIVHSPERLTQPLLKSPAGFTAISWDEALDRIADQFSQITGRQGPGG